MTRVHRPLAAPALASGLLMATYLLLRPYGDTGTPAEAAAAFASPRWLLAHLCGAGALASLAWLASAWARHAPSRTASAAAAATAVGAALVLPYYGAEMYGLHAVGRAFPSGAGALVEQVRMQPVALSLFALGLVGLGAGLVALAVSWSREGRPGARTAWPLAVLTAGLLPQFLLPPVARMAYGVAFLVAAVAVARASGRTAPGPTLGA